MLLEEVKKEIKIEIYPEFKTENEQDYFDTSDHFDTNSNDCSIKPETNIFNCNQCDKTYTKEKRYLKHLQSHCLPFHCPYCEKQFQKESSWQKHLAKHNESTMHDSLKDLYTTVMMMSENGTEEFRYQCQQCGKSFTKPAALSTHINKHERDKDKQFMCDTCSKCFVSKSLLRRHLKLHFEKPHKCTKCEKSYSRSDQLRSHMNTHKDNKPNVCPHCNKGKI